MDFRNYEKRLSAIRRDLHRIPEIGFDLYRTHDYVKRALEEMGYETRVTARTGLIAKKAGKSRNAIAFRSDMDALSVTERTKVSFASEHEGKMHACGHDGHMAILLSFAHYLSTKEDLEKTVVFIFQPAEEGPGGAKVIIEEGMLAAYHVRKIFGFHVSPDLPEGIIGIKDGAMMARNGEFTITIHGTSAHAAKPHEGKDAILVASSLISAYQSIVSRKLDPLSTAVLTVGTICAGEARNIIAREAIMTGTIRAFDDAIYQAIKERIGAINCAHEIAHDVKIRTEILDYYPPVVNDHELYRTVSELLSDSERYILKPMMYAEDFAFYQREVPGLFMMIGTRNEELGFVHPLHSGHFNFRAETLTKALSIYDRICRAEGVYRS
ncbi:MAG: M20 family metallopeptidase [Acholeplasmataceae bacterium]